MKGVSFYGSVYATELYLMIRVEKWNKKHTQRSNIHNFKL